MLNAARLISIFVAGSMLAASLHAGAQQSNQPVRTIGLLAPGSMRTWTDYPVFVETLRKLGHRDGGNLRIVPKEAGGKLDRLPSLARELVEARVDLIVALNTPGARAAIDATRQIPIVITLVGDPVGSGFVTNLARPGGNVTGVSNMVAGIAPKRIAILKEAMPSATRIAVLLNPRDPITAPQVRDVESSAGALGVEARLFPVREPGELPDAFSQIVAWKAHAAVWLLGQQQLSQAMTIKLAAEHRLPVMVDNAGNVAAGGFISYTSDNVEIFRRTAAHVDRILRGTKPGDLPIEQPTKFVLAINRKTAGMLGLPIPPPLLLRADLVVD